MSVCIGLNFDMSDITWLDVHFITYLILRKFDDLSTGGVMSSFKCKYQCIIFNLGQTGNECLYLDTNYLSACVTLRSLVLKTGYDYGELRDSERRRVYRFMNPKGVPTDGLALDSAVQ